MANIILFTDRAPRNHTVNTVGVGLEYYNRPAGAYVLASWLRNLGYSVLVVPHSIRLTKLGVQDFISRNDRDLLWVGLSSTFFTVRDMSTAAYRKIWATSLDLFCTPNDLFDDSKKYSYKTTELVWGKDELNLIGMFLEEKYPGVPLIIGGSWITNLKNGNMQHLRDNVYTVPGNAELYVKKITDDLVNKRGMSVELVNNSEFDSHAFKTSSMSYTENDFIEADEWLSVEVSRGCAFACKYCTYDRKETSNNYKVESLRDELIRNYETHGTTKFHVLDDLYNDDPKKVHILYDKVWSKLPFKAEWVSYMRLDLIWAYPETAEIIRESGCKLGAFGIETLHDVAGKSVGKGLGKTRILETLQYLKEVWGDDVIRQAFFIAGLPHEPKESIEQTIQWLHTTDLLHVYEFFPHWITPPNHKPFLNKISNISKDYDKYQITWNEQGWVNGAGVSWTDAQELAHRAMTSRPHRFGLGLGPYPDVRAMGLTHNESMSLSRDPNFNQIMIDMLHTQATKVTARLENIFNITGK